MRLVCFFKKIDHLPLRGAGGLVLLLCKTSPSFLFGAGRSQAQEARTRPTIPKFLEDGSSVCARREFWLVPIRQG